MSHTGKEKKTAPFSQQPFVWFKMQLNRSLFRCLCGRRPSHVKILLVLIISLTVIFWVSLSGYQQKQSLALTEQQELVAAMNSVNFDTSNKGKNTPRMLMDANNGRLLNQLMSPDQVNRSVIVKPKEMEKKAEAAAKVVGNDTANIARNHHKLLDSKNSTNSSQKSVVISKHNTSPLASDSVRLDPVPSQKGPNSLQLLHQQMRRLNHKQRVLNADKFPPLSNDGLVLIVQVHRRENYLKQLFESLKKAKGIENVLLVISHDYYYDDMNAMVESVDFCRVSE